MFFVYKHGRLLDKKGTAGQAITDVYSTDICNLYNYIMINVFIFKTLQTQIISLFGVSMLTMLITVELTMAKLYCLMRN